jgi:putative ATP-binding cassette transporter
MPQKPYFPLGTLREVMLYPEKPEGIDDEGLREALHKVGLDHLRGRLGDEERWDQILSGGEQQRVAFARVLIQRPEWVFMDEATSALDEAGQANVMRLLAEDLPETAVISIGHRPGLEEFHTRELVLEPGEDGANLRARAGERGLRDIYRRMSAASRAEPVGPGFWSSFRRTLAGR